MNDIHAQITAVTSTAIRPSPPISQNRPSRAASPVGETSRAGSAAATGDKVSISLFTPKPPPDVEKIRRAADASYEEKRTLLAILSSPAPKENRAVDLHA